MSRQKTSEEIEQERRDEEFARQLQAEMVAESNSAAHPQALPRYAAGGLPPNPQPVYQQQQAVSRVTCQYCRSHNNIPVNSGTNQFLCGYCKRLLGFNQGPAAVVQQQQLATYNTNHDSQGYPAMRVSPGPQAPVLNPSQPVYQGSVQPPATIQVRCGQCSVVNAVPRQRSAGGALQFMCGSCQSVNEVSV